MSICFSPQNAVQGWTPPRPTPIPTLHLETPREGHRRNVSVKHTCTDNCIRAPVSLYPRAVIFAHLKLYQHSRRNLACIRAKHLVPAGKKRNGSKWKLFPHLSPIRMAQDAASFECKPRRDVRGALGLRFGSANVCVVCARRGGHLEEVEERNEKREGNMHESCRAWN